MRPPPRWPSAPTDRRCTWPRSARATIAVLDAAALEAGGDHARLASAPHRRCPAAARAASCSTRPASGSTSWRASPTRSTCSTPPPAWRCSSPPARSRAAARSPPAARIPLRRHARLQQRRGSRAPAATSSPTSDGLAWDLGDPDGAVLPNPNPIRSDTLTTAPDFHPMKGPLTTQTLRGIATHGAMHWRGDRTGGYTGRRPSRRARGIPAVQPRVCRPARPRRAAARRRRCSRSRISRWRSPRRPTRCGRSTAP